MGKLGFGVVLAGGMLAWPLAAWGQSDATRAAARELGVEGVEAYQAGDYASASDKLDRAFRTVRVPSLGLWSARALVKVGKLLEASERYLEITRLDPSTGDAAVQKQAQEDAAREREQLLPRIPSLTLQVKGAANDLSVTLDGVEVPVALLGARQPTNPGRHQIEARQAGRTLKRRVTLVEGRPATLELDFTVPEPQAPPPAAESSTAAPTAPTADVVASPRRSVPAGVWVGVALAGAGLATGGVAALVASSKREEMNCPSDVCPQSEREKGESYNDMLTISTIGFVVGGVGLATAGTFWLTRPKPETQAHLTPWVGLGAAGVRGRF